MAKDPVCGMIISEEKSPFKIEYKGETYYFCGKGCEERFKGEPEKYSKGEKVDWIAGKD